MLRAQIEKRLAGFQLRVDLEVDDCVTALFGASGAGKSITLRCIAGLLRPDAGRIEIGGRAVFDARLGIDLPPQRRRVGYVFQSYALFPHLTVAENVGYGLHRLSVRERKERVAATLRSMRLEGLESRRPGQLSGGQQQRVALARALVTRPDVLLLDEPFAALDGITRSRLRQEVLLLLREHRIPTLLVTHDLAEAYALSREIAVIDAGRVLQRGAREEVLRRPASRTVARFVGMKNFIPGRIEEVAPAGVRVAGPGCALWGPPGPFAPGQAVECCIRPEHVMLVPRDRVGALRPGETHIAGAIVQEVDYGNHVEMLFRPARPPAADGFPDLHIEVPGYVYHRLGLAREKSWTVSLQARYIHLLKTEAPWKD